MKRIVVILCILLTCAVTVQANDIELDLQVADSTLILGDEITLQLKVNGAQDPVTIVYPPVDGLSFRQIGPPSSSSQTIIVNGRINRFNGLIYDIGLSATRKGSYHVGAIHVIYDNQTYTTKPFDIRVISPNQQGTMRISVEVSKKDIYLGEPLEVTLKWYLQEDVSDYAFRFPLLDQKDALQLQLSDLKGSGASTNLNVQGYTVPFQQGAETIHDEPFSVYSTTFKFYPNAAGPFVIPVASVKAMVKRGTTVQRDFFDRMIRTPKLERVFATSQEQTVNVKSLPDKGRPDSFTGAVGKFTIQTQTESSKVKVGDPVEVSIIITGEGRLSQIERPVLNDIPGLADDFAVVDNLQPGDIQDNRIVFKQTLRPRNDQVTSIPAIPFSFFDPESKQYQTVTSNSIPIKVLPTRKLDEKEIVAFNRQSSASDDHLVREQQGIYANYTFADALEPQSRSCSWYLLLLLPPLIYLLIRILVARRRHLSQDQSLARSKNARSISHKRLKTARGFIQGDNNLFFQEVIRSLTGYISDKLDLGSGELTIVDINRLGAEDRIAADMVKQIVEFLERIDRIRFTNQQISVEEKRTIYQEVEGLFSSLSKTLK